MRVSSEYNKIAVPYLYEYITIGPGDRSPFAATTENMIRRPIQRKSAEKMNNLAMVKGIAISAPYKDDGDWNLPNRGLPLDWLRISERICCEEYINDVCHPYTSGDALEQLRPGKFIVKTSLSQPILAYAWTAKKVVLVHLPVTDPNFCAAFPSIELGGKPEEIVYIFWSKGPSHPSLTCGESGLDELCGDLWRDRLRPNQAPKAVFVNAGGIDPFQFDLINPTYQEKETTFRAVFNDTFGLPGPSAGDWAPRDHSCRHARVFMVDNARVPDKIRLDWGIYGGGSRTVVEG
jgi:hypothetical protein